MNVSSVAIPWLLAVAFVQTCEARTSASMQREICADAVRCHWAAVSEGRILAKLDSNATRNNKVLSLKLEDGRMVELVDVLAETESVKAFAKMVEYRLFEDLRSPAYFGVWMSRYESAGALLINRKTGQRTLVDEVPTFSPDGTRLVTVDFKEAHSRNRLQVWTLSPLGMSMEWEFRPNEYWSNVDAVWLDSSRIRITWTAGWEKPVERHLEVVLEIGKWKLIR